MRFLIAIVISLAFGNDVYAQDLTGQVYLLADDVLNEDCEVVTDCDCCDTDLAFLTKDTFAMAVRCRSGDTFYAGTYETTPTGIILNYKQYAVSELRDENYNWVANEKKEAKLAPDRFEIESCDDRMVLKNLKNRRFKSGSRLQKQDEAAITKEFSVSQALLMFE